MFIFLKENVCSLIQKIFQILLWNSDRDKAYRTFLEQNQNIGIFLLPVALGTGIYIYFSWPQEPSGYSSGAALAFSGIFVILTWQKGFRSLFLGLWIIILGFNISLWRTHRVNPNPLWIWIPPVTLEGQVRSIESIPSPGPNTYRITLKEPTVFHPHVLSLPARFPTQVRLTVPNLKHPPLINDRIRILAQLFPFQDTPCPESYDWNRHLFFQGIGASGRGIGKLEIIHSSQPQYFDLNNLRNTISKTFLNEMSNLTGPLAAALVTGHTCSIPQHCRKQFNDAGIAHLLAISGLHLALVAGMVIVLTRTGIALIPAIALRWPPHKISALLAIGSIIAYSSLAGWGVPVYRAFIMTSLGLLGLLIDRKAIPLRLLSLAATTILLTQPEALFSPSFQMSFAAVLSLITLHNKWVQRYRTLWQEMTVTKHPWIRNTWSYLIGSILSSLFAILATTAYEMISFHRITVMGIVSNLFAIPLTTFMILPSALLSCLLMGVNCHHWTLPVLDWSLNVLHAMSAWVSRCPGAVISTGSCPPEFGICVTLGGLWFYLVKGPVRWYGWAGIILGTIILLGKSPPDLFFNGKIMGFYEAKTNTLWVSRPAPFTRNYWMETNNIAYWKMLPYSHNTPDWICDHKSCFHKRKKILLAYNARSSPWKNQAEIVISLKSIGKSCSQARLIIDKSQYKHHGSYTIWLGPPLQFNHNQGLQGKRPWNRY